MTNPTNVQEYPGNGGKELVIPKDIWEVQHITYRIILPFIIVIGLAVNSLGAVVLSRSKLRITHVNTYFRLLLISDVLIFMASIPTVRTLNGCNLYSYNYALYFAHVFFTLFYVIQTFSMYLILWVSYDRFLAIWNFKRFNEIQKPKVIRVRVVCTLVICILLHLKHLFEVGIVCSSARNPRNVTLDCKPEIGNDAVPPSSNSICGTTPAGLQRHSDYTCDDGIWIIDDGLHYIKQKQLWQQIYWVVRGLIVSAIPITLVVSFNLGIVGGILHQRFRSTTSTKRTQRRDLSRIYIILAISATFIICTIPTLIHAAFYAGNIDNCHGPYSEEIFRATANLLLLVEHISHFVILCFNENFWDELKIVVSIPYQYVKSFIQKLPLSKSHTSNAKCNDDKLPTEAPAPKTTSPIPPPAITIGMDDEDPGPDKITLQVPTQSVAFSNTTQPETPPVSDTLHLPRRRSPTASMVTLEEIL